jgi:hypothetical protein
VGEESRPVASVVLDDLWASQMPGREPVSLACRG